MPPRRKKQPKPSPFKARLLRAAATLLLLPYLLAIIYIFLPPISTLMLADLVSLNIPKRYWVPLDRISPNLVAAVVLSEDSAFCDHFGFDFNQIQKSIDKAIGGRNFSGASTITQQTVKNLFLWNGRSWVRKILEVPLTIWLELLWSKHRILEVYLNIAEWGPGIYGAEAAAQYHFGSSADYLSRQRASLLATALPDPLTRSASHPGEGLRALALHLELRITDNTPDLSCLK
jgi:monofunctional glycosyltransferase